MSSRNFAKRNIRDPAPSYRRGILGPWISARALTRLAGMTSVGAVDLLPFGHGLPHERWDVVAHADGLRTAVLVTASRLTRGTRLPGLACCLWLTARLLLLAPPAILAFAPGRPGLTALARRTRFIALPRWAA